MTTVRLLTIFIFAAQLVRGAAAGTVVGWGSNRFGQATGIPSSESSTGVVTVAGHLLDDATSVAAGSTYALALKRDGTVVGWGSNFRARTLGIDTGKVRSTNGPVTIDGRPLKDVVKISAAEASLALVRSGEVVTWGRSRSGPDGKPLLARSDLGEASAIAAGYDYFVALKKDGDLIAWGEGRMPPASLHDVTAIAVSSFFDGHGLALTKDGHVTAWALRHPSSSLVAGATNVVAIAAGWDHYLALRSDGFVLQWGTYNPPMGGSLSGEPAVNLSAEAAMVGGKVLTNIIAIAAGGTHSLALKKDGTVIAWGTDWRHQSETPVQLDVPAGLKGVVAIVAGDGFSLAITTNNPPLPQPKRAR